MTETKHKHDKTGAIRLKGCPECNTGTKAKAPFTPGPWHWCRNADTDQPELVSGWGRKTRTVLTVVQRDFQGPDALMVRAAPTMYEALRMVLARLDLEAAERGDNAVFPCSAMRDDIRAALAQADGR